MSVTATGVKFAHAAIKQTDPSRAIDELDERIGLDKDRAVILYVSADYDLARLAGVLRRRVSGPVLCCTTAGEISSELGYTTGGIAAAGITGCQAEVLSMTTVSRGMAAIDPVLPAARQYVSRIQPEQNAIGLLVADGLCHREELVIEQLQAAMPAVPIVGGSAGDSCHFHRTMVYVDGRFQSDAAAVLLLSGEFTAIPFQTHHFASSGVRLVATKTDPAARRVMHLDGIAARVRLGQVLGCSAEDITTEWLATRPLMLKIGDTLFVRSVRSVHEDGSLSLLCAVHEGEILHVGTVGEIVDTTGSYFEALRHQQSTPDLVLGFDCILRRMELALKGRTAEMNETLRQVRFIGFSTFGEQFNGQHVNQTMTGVALWTK